MSPLPASPAASPAAPPSSPEPEPEPDRASAALPRCGSPTKAPGSSPPTCRRSASRRWWRTSPTSPSSRSPATSPPSRSSTISSPPRTGASRSWSTTPASWTASSPGRDRRRDLGARLRGQRHCRHADHPGSAAAHARRRQGRDRQRVVRGEPAGAASGVAYAASKHAVNGLTKSTTVFYKGQGVRCNAVAPGPVATAIEAPFLSAHAGSVVGPFLQATIPPVAQPEDLAAAITRLAGRRGRRQWRDPRL